jgi:hypothetical protein
MRRIDISDGYTVLIDSEDAELVTGFDWRPLRLDNGLVYAHAWRGHLHVYMHRLILGPRDDQLVDHANGNGLDNRKDNLRAATHSQNHANTGKMTPRRRATYTSQYKGVFWDAARNKWQAQIAAPEGGRRRSLGRFATDLEAARAYDAAALAQWGEFARLNFECEGAA